MGAPLDLADPAGFATAFKLARRLRDDPGRCRAVLDRSALEVMLIDERNDGGFCGLRNAVAIERSAMRYSGPVRVSCSMAAALYLWEREVVAPAAARHLGAGVKRIDHLGTYAWRRVNGSATGRPSQHATALTSPPFGFPTAGEFPCCQVGAAIRASAPSCARCGCRLFRGVLSPDYNEAHRDHFHLDMGPYSLCR